MITEEQITSALNAATDEFDLWRLASMGQNDHRVYREPKVASEVPPSDECEIEIWPLHLGLDAAKVFFKTMRTRASMRKALESFNA